MKRKRFYKKDKNKKIKLDDIPNGVIFSVIAGFLDLEDFLHISTLNKNIRDSIFNQESPSNNIIFPFHTYPTEKLCYVKNLKISYNIIGYFNHVKNRKKNIYHYFPNMKKLFIVRSSDMDLMNIMYHDDIFTKHFLPVSNLHSLSLDGYALFKLPNIKNVELKNSILETNTIFQEMVDVEKLTLKNVQIPNLDMLDHLTKLKNLYLDVNSKIEKIDFGKINLLQKKNLNHLTLHVNDLKNLNLLFPIRLSTINLVCKDIPFNDVFIYFFSYFRGHLDHLKIKLNFYTKDLFHMQRNRTREIIVFTRSGTDKKRLRQKYKAKMIKLNDLKKQLICAFKNKYFKNSYVFYYLIQLFKNNRRYFDEF